MYKFNTRAVFLVSALTAISPASAQDDLVEQTRALKVIEDTAYRLCNRIPLEGKQNDADISGEAQAGLTGVLAKFASLGIKGNAYLNDRQYHGLVQDQLAAALKDSQDCRRDVLNILVDRILPQRSQNAPATTLNAPATALSEPIDADISDDCGKLQFWPGIDTPINSLIDQLRKLYAEISDQNISLSKRTLANLNRCLGAAYLVSGKGLPGNLKDSLPYLARSLSYDPDQLLLRQNIQYLDRMLQTGSGDTKLYCTSVFQVLRGENDPELADLAQWCNGAAMV